MSLKGLEQLWLLITTKDPGTHPPQTLRDTCVYGLSDSFSVWLIVGRAGSGFSLTSGDLNLALTPSLPFCFCSLVLVEHQFPYL